MRVLSKEEQLRKRIDEVNINMNFQEGVLKDMLDKLDMKTNSIFRFFILKKEKDLSESIDKQFLTLNYLKDYRTSLIKEANNCDDDE